MLEQVSSFHSFKSTLSVKAVNNETTVDAVTGATLTSNGVSDMLQDGFKKYNAALKKN